MGKEVENLIMENNELLATKWATTQIFSLSHLQNDYTLIISISETPSTSSKTIS